MLDIGCGWGATVNRALERYDVNVIGLTLSENQKAHVEKVFAESGSPRSKRVLLQGWEQFDEPVDRIVSIGAFEHFGRDRYDDFFKKAYAVLPDDGVMMLHTIIKPTDEEFAASGLPLTMRMLKFSKFIMDEIFPGGDLPKPTTVEGHAAKAGFELTARAAAAAALRAHAGHLGGGARGPQGRGDRDPVPRGLRPVHEVPDRLRRTVPRGLHRRLPVHAGQELVPPICRRPQLSVSGGVVGIPRWRSRR